MYLTERPARRRLMARCRAVSSSFMVSSAVRPLPVARGGRSSHEREPGGGHGYRREHRLRHQSRRCVVAPEREKLYDALSEKAPRCVVGSQLRYGGKAAGGLLSKRPEVRGRV